MKKWIFTAIIMLGIVLFYSCKDQYDFSMDNLSTNIEQESEFAIPLINADISLSEFLPDNDDADRFLVIDENNFITLKFEYEVKQVLASDFFDGNYVGPSLPLIEYAIDPQIIDLGMNAFIKQGEFYIADPKIKLFIKNYWDVSTQFRFTDFYYYKEPTSTPVAVTGSLFSNWITVAKPTAPGGFAITEIVLDTANTNIDELISALPHHLSFGADFETIAGGAFNIAPSSSDSVRMEVEIPMDLRISNLVLIDTVDFPLADNAGGDTSLIKSIQLNLIMDNGFPLDLGMQIYFADENYNITDSISTSGIEIKSGSVVNGKVTSRVESTNAIIVDSDKILNLLRSKYLMPKITFNTTNASSNETVKLYSDYSLGLNVGALIKLKIKT